MVALAFDIEPLHSMRIPPRGVLMTVIVWWTIFHIQTSGTGWVMPTIDTPGWMDC